MTPASILMRRCSIIFCSILIFAASPAPAATPDADPVFPKDHPAQAFSELKIYDAQGNPVRTPKEDWDGAKKLVATDPAWAQWAATERATLAAWMGNRHDKVEWVAGWWHNFVSPKDGSFLIFTPDEPGPETLKSPSDPKVLLTPKLHGAWVFVFRGKHAQMMLEAARLYRLTGDPKYAEWASAQLDFYADHYMEWPIQTTLSKSRLMGQSLDEAVNLITYVQTARTLGDYVTAERKQRWTTELFKPEAALLGETFQTIHNIACWQRSAVGHVALYCGDDALWKQAVEDPYGIRDQVARGVTSDYLWREQSLGYNSYVVDALTPFFSYALMEGRGKGLEVEMQTVENLMLSTTMMRFPTGRLPNPADITGFLHAPDEVFLGKMAQLYPTKIGVRKLEQEKSWSTLLDPPAANVPEPTLPAVVSHSLESTQMAILRSGPWQIFFHYGQLTGSHAQAEALNFEAFFNDTQITHDPGTVGYGSPLSAGYYKTGLAHNVPLVDGLGQESWKLGKLDNFTDTSVTASQPMYRSNASAARALTIEGDRLNDSESISTTDGKPHALGFLLHLDGKAQLSSGFVTDTNFIETHPVPGFKYWTDVVGTSGHDQAEFDVVFGTATFHVTLNLPGDFKIWHASAPDFPPTRSEVFFLETQGTSAVLKTTIEPVTMK